MGKGSAPRPFIVDRSIYENNFDAIFGKKNATTNSTSNSGNAACETSDSHGEIPEQSEVSEGG